ncbi:MAG: family 1 glycosylhydrolase [Nitrospiraceae bacterium]|nr:family 1 glycosylhydrolase [Nitrospiraceae bacterium]
MTTALRFPQGFRWGTAVSSHQVEGNNTNNQWWAWENVPGHIWHGDKSGIACNWWRQAERDFDLAAQLNQNALRFSLEWSRIEPEEGFFDQSALRRYRRMLEELHSRGIEPMVTLHHFTNPLWLEVKGGWENPDTVKKFRQYAVRVVEYLGDLVPMWCTVNEPGTYALQGYLTGLFPPGKKSFSRAFRVLANLLKAHGEAYRAIHMLDGKARVGLVKNLRPLAPKDPTSPTDVRLAHLFSYLFNDLGLRPAVDGWLRFPLSFRPAPFGPLIDSLDFVGVNYYSPTTVGFSPKAYRMLFMKWGVPEGVEVSDSGRYGPYGAIVPEGIYWAIKYASQFGKPIYITENGIPDADDDQRPQFILNHLAQVHRAMSEGYDVRGYYYWSLIDNFEWCEGWGLRFGLIALNTKTQKRTLRHSGEMYGKIAGENAITPEITSEYAPKAMEDGNSPAFAESLLRRFT